MEGSPPVPPPLALQYKSSAVSLLTTDDDVGVVEALVAITGVVDDVNDLILPGALAKSLLNRRPKGVRAHNLDQWVSAAAAAEEWLPGDPRLPATTADGRPWPKEAGALWVRAEFNLGTQVGRDTYSDVVFYSKRGQCYWSIGYVVPAGGARKRPDGVRLIAAIDVHEYSPVLFGAASWTGTLLVKSAPGLPLPRRPGPAGRPAAPLVLEVKRRFTAGQRQNAADAGHALDDGSYPIKTVDDLRNAVQAYGRCPEGKRPQLRKLIVRRAKALGRPDLIPDAWGSSGKKYATGGVVPADAWSALLETPAPFTIAPPLAGTLAGKSGVPKVADTPRDMRNTRQLIAWYERGEGAARIRWGEPGDFMRCVRIAAEHMTDEQARGFCNVRHRAVLGVAPGQEAPGHKTWEAQLHGETLETKDFFPNLPGSYEEHIAAVTKAVTDALRNTGQNGGAGQDDGSGQNGGSADTDSHQVVMVAGTWPDHAVATVYTFAGGGAGEDRQSYQVQYTMAEDGSVTISGEPEPVELTVTVAPSGQTDATAGATPDTTATDAAAAASVPVMDAVDQATKVAGALLLASPQTKAGRVLSAASAGLIGEAVKRLLQVLTAAGIDAGMGSDQMEGKTVITAAELEAARALIAEASSLA